MGTSCGLGARRRPPKSCGALDENERGFLGFERGRSGLVREEEAMASRALGLAVEGAAAIARYRKLTECFPRDLYGYSEKGF